MAQDYQRRFGEITGQPEGTWYPDRDSVRLNELHAHNRTGISGIRTDGADAIVLSGGYEDDEDHGDAIVYTGHGGQKNGSQAEDQDLNDTGNAALVKNQLERLPVRVIRGWQARTDYSPSNGYRYDGLYRVMRHWFKTRDDGYRVCQFLLVKISSSRELEDRNYLPTEPENLDSGHDHEAGSPAERVLSTRIRRNSKVTENVKNWHSNRCQVCGNTIALPVGPRSEAAHIQPLGFPHDGPDIESNALCLCPNDHLRFDNGALYLTDDLAIVDAFTGSIMGELRRHPSHRIDIRYVREHRKCWVKEEPPGDA
ncbi:YDG/SRA domain-containing protein [Streptomonospora alba]|uniref:YDG/SRA domain-containing protein n=1 Tax=Streptomonospora alba TaxID=183763 RepID=UPI000A009BF4|nr:YDG/SRA domain-containing protein [Streptomonospora alba]